MHVPMCVSTLPHRMHLSSCQVITFSCLMAKMCNNTAAPKCALWNFCGRLKLRCGHVMARMKSLHVGGDPGSSRCVRAGPAVGLSGGGVRGAGVPVAFCICTLPPHAGFRLHAGRGPMFPCRRRADTCKYPLLRPSRLCGSRPFSSPLSALRFLFPRNCSFAKAG